MRSTTTDERAETPPDVPESMRAVVAGGYGDTDVLDTGVVPVPTPGAGDVLVRVEASSLNALDWHFLTGTPYLIRITNGLRRPKRTIPGADVAGTVVAVGSDVTVHRVGDAVFGECEGGGCGEYLTVDAKEVVAVPVGVSFEAAGATPVAGLTAVQALRTHAALQPGEHALINGAAGGVGTFAVQIAKALGAEVTAVCSARNVDVVRALGADTVIDYTTTDFVDGGARFDVMMDNVGNRTPAECLAVLRPGARFVAVSGPKTDRWLGPIPHIIRTALAVRRADASFHQFTASPNEADLRFLGDLLAEGRLTPEIDRVIGLDGVAAGLAEIGTGHTRAKIVVRPS
ncbi:NAD(P)-dependent alcohol dehydrogenase [Ilumatobacter sp.]|uniref:NAD(P)-dependent alcohol dehydrogenase n=1 Tax=Ilumatobacter sp. TaxID=1967498 RepID=UPI003B5223ED